MFIRAKIILLIYLLQALVPRWIWEEVGKIPGLVQHYQVHQVNSPDPVSFIEFLSLHYGKAYQKHFGDHDHSDLPMKHHSHEHDCCTLALSLAALPEVPGFQLSILPGEQRSSQFHEPQCWLQSFSGSIFQPPRAG
jgi:hypothetical protein